MTPSRPESVTGTLVLVMPTADGIVVSADSRGMTSGKPFDGRRKLHVATTRSPVAYAITGAADFPWSPPPGHRHEDWLAEAPYFFRASNSARDFLETNAEIAVTEESLMRAGKALVVGYGSFFADWPHKRDEFTGRDLCRLVLCQVDASSGDALYGGITLAVEADGEIVLSSETFRRYSSTDEMEIQANGAGNYLNEVVLNGVGKQFLSDEAKSLLDTKFLIGDFHKLEAARLGKCLIQAAERSSEIVAIPDGVGIGGPVTQLLVTATLAEPFTESPD